MMHADVTGMLRREFASRTQAEAFRFFQQQEAEQRKRRDREDDLDKDVAALADLAAAALSAEQARELRIQIDRYDAATVDALYENEQALVHAQARVDELLAKAYVLPDGRRVFKTEDGQHVYDEHGNELDLSVIDPDTIEDWRPHWEVFDAASDEVERLEQERTELIAYQDKLDAARERLDAGDMTQAEYDCLQQVLVNEMPDAVRRQIPELADMEPEAEPQVASTDTELDIADEHIPTNAGPRAPIPGG
ncbi:MAG: hypothetical protein WDZ83_20320 [Rhizobiaceae bacterium]